MKNYRFVRTLTVLFFSFYFFSTEAQQPWCYGLLKEAHLDDAYFTEPPVSLKAQIDKLVGKQKVAYNCLYRLSVDNRKAATLRFQNDSLDFSLPESLVVELYPFLISDRYWRDHYGRLQEWAFIRMDNSSLVDVDTSDHRYGQFVPVSWFGYTYQPSVEWPVVFSIRTNTHVRQTLTLPALQRLAEWGAFTTDEGMRTYERDLELQRQKERERQRILQQQLDSLEQVRQEMARQADSIKTALHRDSLNQAELQLQAQVQNTKERMNREQIFLMSVNPARSDYMFGLEFNFYNCFSKIISKIEITVTPVNTKGQIQKDQFSRDVRTIRCMGPIHPGSPAQYTFDELFWDDKGRIKFMRVTSITFHFPDGTRKNFYGYEKILKHTLNL